MRYRFSGRIAGFGTSAGVRIVIGVWTQSPFGSFTDVMIQTREDVRVLLAPDDEIAEFVSSTYSFDRVVTGPVTAQAYEDRMTIAATELAVSVEIGRPAPVDRLLRLVPAPLATAPWWLRLIDPIASRMVPGVHTAGAARAGSREYYGVLRSRHLTAVTGRYAGQDLGTLAPLHPPVQFGFSSAPASPQIVSVTTTIER